MAVAKLNSDMGESFGIYTFGNDAEIIKHIDSANVACGFHGSDFNHMRRTVRLAKAAGVGVGAHPSLPDLQGFGRRVMAIGREELANCLIYQIGALSGFLTAEGVALTHIKPHGALYGMAARDPEVAHAVCDAADIFKVPLFGLAGTVHETVYGERGHTLVPEFFADTEYDDDGFLIIERGHPYVPPELAVERTMRAVRKGVLRSAKGKELPTGAETICVHSDTPNAPEIVKALAAALAEYAS
jgi:UPF0271 protein